MTMIDMNDLFERLLTTEFYMLMQCVDYSARRLTKHDRFVSICFTNRFESLRKKIRKNFKCLLKIYSLK
jgi:hypothetical protein